LHPTAPVPCQRWHAPLAAEPAPPRVPLARTGSVACGTEPGRSSMKMPSILAEARGARRGRRSSRRLDLDRRYLPGPVALRALRLGPIVTREVPEAVAHRAVNELIIHQIRFWRSCGHAPRDGHAVSAAGTGHYRPS
jgi:hypothetical protein